MKTSYMTYPLTSAPAAQQRGISLVDLLASLLISSIIMAGVVQVYSSQAGTSRLQENLSELQESGRFALQIIARDIRSSAYAGCTAPKNLQDGDFNNTLDDGSVGDMIDPISGVVGWEYDGTAYGEGVTVLSDTEATQDATAGAWLTSVDDPLPLDTVIMSVPYSDVLRVWGNVDDPAKADDVRDTSGAGGNSITVTMVDTPDLEAGNFIFLSDCNNTVVAQICSVNGNDLVLGENGNGSCDVGNDISQGFTQLDTDSTYVFNAQPITYWVGKLDDNPNNPPALFRDRGNGPEELVPGVQSMQVLYGEDVNNDNGHSIDRYVTAEDVEAWANVKAVRILLLSATREDNILRHIKDFEFNGVDITPADKRARRVFTSTISMRNRMTGAIDR